MIKRPQREVIHKKMLENKNVSFGETISDSRGVPYVQQIIIKP